MIIKPSPRAVYAALYKHFGPQGWWPVTPAGSSIARYRPRRYHCPTPLESFEICVGAILTQNTAWANVEKAISNLWRARVFSPAGISRLRTTRLAALIRPSGYFNQKAERLKAFSRYVINAYHGNLHGLFAKELPLVRRELLSLNGVGPETADCMVLYAGRLPTFVIDAYTLRMGRRLGWFEPATTYDEAKKSLECSLTPSVELYSEYHALIDVLGKDFCRPAPRCACCPIRKYCAYGRCHSN